MAGLSDDEFVRSEQKIRESTAHSLQILNDTLRIGIETTEELDRQAESLERTERNLDRMNHDLDSSKRMMNVIKSPFHALFRSSSSKKSDDDAADVKRSKKAAGKESSDQTSRSPSLQNAKSTGDVVVDQSLDEMSKALHQLRGVGELMSEQLDDSDRAIGRIDRKMERADVKMKKVTKDIKKELQ
eukprot:Em0015g709a